MESYIQLSQPAIACDTRLSTDSTKYVVGTLFATSSGSPVTTVHLSLVDFDFSLSSFLALDTARGSTASDLASMTATSKGTLNIYMPNGSSNAIKYMEGTDVNAVVQLVVNRLGHGPRAHARSYALYLRHTDTTKV